MSNENLNENEFTGFIERALSHFEVGNFKLDSENPVEAINEYREAIQLWDEDARFYNNLGIAYRQQGDLSAAEQNLARAIELDPKYRDAYSNLGLALLDREMYQEAVANFTIAIELDPTFWYAYNGRGLALWALGKKEEALSDYAKMRSLE